MYGAQMNGYPQQGGYNQGGGPLRYDVSFIDTLVGTLSNLMSRKNERADVAQALLNNLNFRDNRQPTVDNANRLGDYLNTWLRNNGIQAQPGGLSSQFVEQAMIQYLNERIPALTQRVDQIQAQRHQQQGQYGYGQNGGYGMMAPQQHAGMVNPTQAIPLGSGSGQTGGATYGQQGFNPTNSFDVDYSLGPVTSSTTAQPQNTNNNQQASQPQQSTQASPSWSQHQQALQEQWNLDRQSHTASPNSDPFTSDAPIGVFGNAPPKLGSVNISREVLEDELLLPMDLSRLTVHTNSRFVAELPGDAEAQSCLFDLAEGMNSIDDAINTVQETVIDDLRQGEYLHLLRFNELSTLNLPTEDFVKIRDHVREHYKKGPDGWKTLLNVLNGAAFRSTKIIDEFLVAQINRSLVRYFRAQDNLKARVTLNSLFDLTELMEGKFTNLLRDLPSWRSTLDLLINGIIQSVFIEDDVVLTAEDDNLADMVRCNQIDIRFEGVSKYDLAFVTDEQKTAYIEHVFETVTILRLPREVLLTNMLTKTEALTEGLTPNANMNDNQKLFWTFHNYLAKNFSADKVDTVCVFKGTDWQLIAEEFQAIRMMAYPITKEGKRAPTLISSSYMYDGIPK